MPTNPLPTDTRQKRLNRQLLATFAASLVAGAAAGAAVAFAEEGGPVFLSVAAVGLAAAAVAGWYGWGIMLRYWRGLDELARDAHKTAWFWGGSAGLLAALVPYTMLTIAPRWAGLSERDADLLILGGATCAVLQLVGYGLFWAGFWLRAGR